jgi:hypothetical protein
MLDFFQALKKRLFAWNQMCPDELNSMKAALLRSLQDQVLR